MPSTFCSMLFVDLGYTAASAGRKRMLARGMLKGFTYNGGLGHDSFQQYDSGWCGNLNTLRLCWASTDISAAIKLPSFSLMNTVELTITIQL